MLEKAKARFGDPEENRRLLRPVEASPDEPGTLLRPATGSGGADPEKLLRPANGEDDPKI